MDDNNNDRPNEGVSLWAVYLTEFDHRWGYRVGRSPWRKWAPRDFERGQSGRVSAYLNVADEIPAPPACRASFSGDIEVTPSPRALSYRRNRLVDGHPADWEWDGRRELWVFDVVTTPHDQRVEAQVCGGDFGQLVLEDAGAATTTLMHTVVGEPGDDLETLARKLSGHIEAARAYFTTGERR